VKSERISRSKLSSFDHITITKLFKSIKNNRHIIRLTHCNNNGSPRK
jgi:hypothetical protein